MSLYLLSKLCAALGAYANLLVAFHCNLGANMIHKHVKPRRQGETGGIIDAEGAIYASKVALYCSKCDKGVRAKVAMEGDNKIRVCAKCGAKL